MGTGEVYRRTGPDLTSLNGLREPVAAPGEVSRRRPADRSTAGAATSEAGREQDRRGDHEAGWRRCLGWRTDAGAGAGLTTGPSPPSWRARIGDRGEPCRGRRRRRRSAGVGDVPGRLAKPSCRSRGARGRAAAPTRPEPGSSLGRTPPADASGRADARTAPGCVPGCGRRHRRCGSRGGGSAETAKLDRRRCPIRSPASRASPVPTPSGLLKIEPGAAKAATNRRQPAGRSRAACSGRERKSRGPDGGWEGSRSRGRSRGGRRGAWRTRRRNRRVTGRRRGRGRCRRDRRRRARPRASGRGCVVRAR